MSGIDGSILAQLEQIDPEEAQFLAEEIDASEDEKEESKGAEYTFEF